MSKKTSLTNLASDALGTTVIHCSDEFFGAADRMLQTSEPLFIEGKYDDNGKWMDGWETRRRRDGKNDFCYLRLGASGSITEFDIDTRHFTGNYTPAISIEGFNLSVEQEQAFVENDCLFKSLSLLSPTDLQGDTHNFFDASSNEKITHLKITMYPDGGIARFRAYGKVHFDETLFNEKDSNVISIYNGAHALYANDEHFGCLENILFEHEPLNMADGWETRRRREPGNDWGIIRLAKPAHIKHLCVDTRFFKGNFPHAFSIQAANVQATTEKAIISQSMYWSELVLKTPLDMNCTHVFNNTYVSKHDTINYVRINIYPDGGIARLKLFGQFRK